MSSALGRPLARATISLVFVACLVATATAQPANSKRDQKIDDLGNKRLELRGVEDTLSASEEQRRDIEAQIESIRADRSRLLAAVLDTTQKVGEAEKRSSAVESRLETLSGSEEAIKRSLAARRGVIAEVLASLQRFGRRPPPAIIVSPQDMLHAIRTSMLLGAVLPEMRAETEALASDLSDLVQLRQSIKVERAALDSEKATLSAERLRLDALVAARQDALTGAERALGAERARADELGRQATSLKDLVARMEAEIGPAARGAEAARKADELLRLAGIPKGSPFRDSGRLAPAIAFADARGLLPLPVAGTPVKNFGTADGFGGTEKGLFMATRGGAVVAAPCDGWIAFAGPWRSYGQLLIINAGQGYYVVLAGMERINVDLGQFVLTGEPVAAMGDGAAKTAAAVGVAGTQPVLYVEFRKDGTAIDPGPWWAKAELQKVRG